MEQQQFTEFHRIKTKSSEGKAKDQQAEAKLMSLSIAMFMAVVAMLGAVTAYRAALAEQETLRYERRLQQGEMLELVNRQELLSKVSGLTRYENTKKLHKQQADSARDEAQKLATVDRPRAAVKKLQAEEEGAYVRSLQPYLLYFDVGVPSDSDLEAPIAKQTAEWLRTLGFDTVWEAPAADGSSPNIWEKLEKAVSQGHRKVMRLAAGVVLFVLALAFLTFAQLSHNQPKTEKALAWIGGALAMAGLTIAMWADHASWKDLLAFTVGFGVLALIGAPLAKRFHFAAKDEAEESFSRDVPPAYPVEDECGEDGENEPVHPAEVEPALFAGMRLHFAPVAHKFGRFVISMIAICAVLSALSGFFYSRAAVASSKAISAALEDQAEIFRMNSRRVTEWNKTLGRVATAEDYHLRYEAARQRLELAKEEPSLLSQKDAIDQVQQRQRMLKQFEEKEPQAHRLMTGPLGPEQDVNFPWKLVISQSYHDPAKTLARWSAHNEMSLGYQREATTYLALLTLFAIALYLLGQALGMGRTSAAFILVLFACGLAFAGIMRGLFVSLADKAIVLKPATQECRLPNEIADNDLVELAAEHFARGWVLFSSFSDDPVELANAAKEFHCAVQIRPTFAVANLYFARATNGASTPQLNEGGFVSLISKDALGKVSLAEQQARDLLTEQGFAPPMDLVGDYGFDTYADGLVKGDRHTLDRGKQATDQAIALDENNLVSRFNLGVAQLAEGQEKQALDTYQHAVAMGGPGKEALVAKDPRVIGGAITDLDVFRQYCSGLNNAAYCKQFASTDLPKLKSEFVAAAWPAPKGRTLAGSGIKLTDLHLVGSSAELGWSGQLQNVTFDAGGKPQDSLAVLWYAYSPDWKAWRVLPAISERVKADYYAQGHPNLLYSVLRASGGRICLQSGQYRAELYVNGEIAGSQELTLQNEDLKPVTFPDLDVALCHPASWQRWQSSDADAVWTRGLIEDRKNRGVFVFSFFDSQQDGQEVTEERALRRAEGVLRKESLAPEPATGQRLYDCTGLRAHAGETMAAFSDNGGTSIAKAWITPEGLVNVVAVVDKQLNPTEVGKEIPAQPQARQDCEILLSATTVQ